MKEALESLDKVALIALLERERTAAFRVRQSYEERLSNYEFELKKSQNEAAGQLEVISSYSELITQQKGLILQKEEQITLQEEQVSQAKETVIQKESEIANYASEISLLKITIAHLKRMLFGQKRERFEGDSNQLSLPFEVEPKELEQHQEEVAKKIEYIRKHSNHKGRAKLPKHLPVEEIEIHPDGDLSEMTCIGKEITEELEYEPAKFYIKRYIRYKYAHKSGEGVHIGELPERIIEKGIPSESLLAMILISKYQDHLPLYRLKQMFARSNIEIASSTLEGWTRQGLTKLEPLYETLLFDMKSKGYLQVDETTIKVQDRDKKGACHLGYYWVYHSPIDGNVLFNYQPSRAARSAAHILDGFRGYLQTDGYAGYEGYGKKKDVVHLACWAHARREFEKALSNDRKRAEFALLLIQKLYAVERSAKEQKLTPAEIKQLRLDKSLPIINELGKWISSEYKEVLPKSSIGKALYYSFVRWDSLSAYLYDGTLQIDNNSIENSIRPIALGRKNYLFAGSHEAAQRAAMIYSFFAICKKHDVNPYEWLKYVLQNINTINHKNIRDLYPQNYKKLIEEGKI